MKAFLALLSVQLRTRYGLSTLRVSMREKKGRIKRIGMALLITVSVLYLLALYVLMSYGVFIATKQMGVPELSITIAALLCGLLVLFFGIFYILSSLFFSKDTEFLSSLPVKQGTVFLSKFVLVLIHEYPFVLAIMLPPMVIFGVFMGMGPVYWLLALLVLLLVPVIPLALSALLSTALMGLVGRIRRRELFATVGGILLFALFFIGNNMLVARIPSDNPEEFLLQIMQNTRVLVELAGSGYPPAVWITRILSAAPGAAALNFLFLLLTSAGGLLLALLLASRVYQTGAQAQLETSKGRKTKARAAGALPPALSIFINEWRVLLRTPIYALNGLAGILVAPLILAMPLFGGSLATDPDIVKLMELVADARQSGVMMLVVAGILSLMGLMNPAVSTAISREGRGIWQLKMLPLTGRTMMWGKLLCGYSISVLTVVPAALVGAFAFGIDAWSIVMVLLLSLVASYLTSALGLFTDIMNPRLEWDNPQQAIKQNMNVLLSMLLGLVLLVILGGISYLLLLLSLPVTAVFAVMLALCLALSVGFTVVLGRVADRKLASLEA